MSMLASTTSLEIPIGDSTQEERLTLIGRSRAGDATAFCIPQLKLFLDCGAPIQKWTPRFIFLSHTHVDHVHCLTHAVNNKNNNLNGKNTKKPVVLLPAKAVPFVQRYLRVHQEMIDMQMEEESCQEQERDQNNNDNDDDTYISSLKGLELRPTVPGEEITLNGVGGSRSYYVRTVECHHRIDTLGFCVFRKGKEQRVLKPEYIGLPGKEIGRLIKENGQDHLFHTPVTEPDDEAIFCFLGDTTHQVFEQHPEILLQNFSVVIVECSFIDEKDVQRAAQTKHMHWNNLQPYIESHPDILFVLIHFSVKYSSLELRRFFCNISVQHQNIHPMILQQEVEADWANTKKTATTGGTSNKKKGDKRRQKEEDAPPVCNCRICCCATSSGSARRKT